MAADEPFMLRLPSVLAAVLALGLVPAVAHGAGPGAHLPPSGKVYSGLTGSTSMESFRGKPFVFGEWALWGSDDPGFVNQLFGWIGRHSRAALRTALSHRRYQP
jgi:hypothetical protein